MEDLPRLKARIANLGDLRDLIRALRALAASHLQEAQGALGGIRGFVQAIEDSIAAGAALLDTAEQRDGARGPTGEAVAIVVCSEHGFVGAFNELLLDRAERELTAGSRGLAVIGRRGAMLAEERGLDVGWSLPMATHVGGVLAVTRRIAEQLVTAEAVRIVFGAYRRGRAVEVVARDVLPLDPGLLVRSARTSPPLHHLAPAVLLQRLAGEYLFAEISRAVMESLASENGARLGVMENADRNIADKLEAIQRRERALRQESITAELIDVVTGAEAVLGRKR